MNYPKAALLLLMLSLGFGSEAEHFTLNDGRTFVGTYDEPARRLYVIALRIAVQVEPTAIRFRRPAKPDELPNIALPKNETAPALVVNVQDLRERRAYWRAQGVLIRDDEGATIESIDTICSERLTLQRTLNEAQRLANARAAEEKAAKEAEAVRASADLQARRLADRIASESAGVFNMPASAAPNPDHVQRAQPTDILPLKLQGVIGSWKYEPRRRWRKHANNGTIIEDVYGTVRVFPSAEDPQLVLIGQGAELRVIIRYVPPNIALVNERWSADSWDVFNSYQIR